MGHLRTWMESLLLLAIAGQAILVWLEMRAYARFKHMSFLVLAFGTGLGICYSSISLAIYVIPAALAHVESLLVAALIFGSLQVPIAVVGVVLLIRSYGQLYATIADVLPNTSLERTRER